MNWLLFLYQIITESFIAVGIIIGIFFAKSAAYYNYYLLSIACLSLIFFWYKNKTFLPAELGSNLLGDLANSRYSADPVSKPNLLEDPKDPANPKSKKLIAYNVVSYNLIIFLYWSGFLYLSTWFFANLFYFSDLNNKTVKVSFLEVAIIIQQNVFAIMLPLGLVIALVIVFSYFSYVQQKNPLWQCVMIPNVNNKGNLILNRFFDVVLEIAKLFYICFLLAMFCLFWFNKIALAFNVTSPLVHFFISSSISFLAALLLYLLFNFGKSFISKQNFSLWFYTVITVVVAIFVPTVIYVALYSLPKSNNFLTNTAAVSASIMDYTNIFKALGFESNSRVVCMFVGWMLIIAPDFSNLLASKSFGRKTKEIIFTNVLVGIIVFLSIKLAPNHFIAHLMQFCTTTIANIIAGIVITIYLYRYFGRTHSFIDYMVGFLPTYGRKRKGKPLGLVVARLLPNIALYQCVIIFLGWPFVQFLLVGNAFFLVIFLTLFIFYGAREIYQEAAKKLEENLAKNKETAGLSYENSRKL